jgi:type III secretion protein J
MHLLSTPEALLYVSPMVRPSPRLPALTRIVFAASLLGCTVPVAAALDEADANRVVVALDQAGIDASKESDPGTENKFRVLVSRDEISRALATLHEEELPRAKPRQLLDATGSSPLLPSQASEHAQIVAGLSGELEKTLSGLDGVLTARVHLSIPAREPLHDGPPARPTGSVLVEYRGTASPISTDSVQKLVAGGAPGLAPSDVAVVLLARPARPALVRSDLARVGPMTVARGSVLTLKVLLSTLTLLVVALAGATLALWTQRIRLRREATALPSSSSP